MLEAGKMKKQAPAVQGKDSSGYSSSCIYCLHKKSGIPKKLFEILANPKISFILCTLTLKKTQNDHKNSPI